MLQLKDRYIKCAHINIHNNSIVHKHKLPGSKNLRSKIQPEIIYRNLGIYVYIFSN